MNGLSDSNFLFRRISTLEASVARFKAENYRLKMKLEEEADSGQKRKKAKAELATRKVIFENIKFKQEEKEEPKSPSPPPVFHLESRKSKENASPTADQSKPRKTVLMSQDVETMDDDGKREKEGLKVDEDRPKMSRKPLGEESKNRPAPRGKINRVVYADEEAKKMQEQCKQQ